MMKKVPKRRFKGFLNAGDWEQRKLGDVVKRESVTQVSSTEYPAIEYEDVIPETGQLNKDIYKKGVQKAGILFDANKVLYGKLRPYLHNWVAPMYKGVAVGDWWVLNPCGLDRGFLYTLIQTVKFDTIANQSTGSKMPRADWKLLSTTEFSIPSLDEQIKIGKLVEGLNDYITLHQRKLEKLQATKKALLYELFPIENSRRPKRRFKGFTDDWEQRKLGEITERYDNLRVPITANLRIPGNTPYYGANGIQDYVEGHTHEGEFVLVAEDGANDLKNYPVQFVNGRIWVNNHAHVLQGKKDIIDNHFLAYAIRRTNMGSLLVGGSRPKLNAETLMKIAISVPEIEEQRMVGTQLNQFDNLITLHQEESFLHKYMLEIR